MTRRYRGDRIGIALTTAIVLADMSASGTTGAVATKPTMAHLTLQPTRTTSTWT